MNALIKIGGTLLDDAQSRRRLAEEIAQALGQGLRTVVVHGGGKQMTRFLAERGVETNFVNGLRVTTPDVLDAVLKVFAGSVNQELVGAFAAAGIPAVGLTGMDGFLTEAVRMAPELGFVGKPVRSNVRLLEILAGNGYLPVVACVAGDRTGQFYNVNADQMAASLASALRVDHLFFLTDVEGVKGPDNSILPAISPEDCRQLIESGTATGGMRAKLDAAVQALDGGVREVVIAPGAAPGMISSLLAGEGVGTRLLAQREVARNG